MFAKSNLVQNLTAILNLEFQIYPPWLFMHELKFLNLRELGLLNLKFILARKAKFSPKFNYIDFIFLKNLSVVVKKFLSDNAYWI